MLRQVQVILTAFTQMLKLRAIAYNPNLISSSLWNSHQCIKKKIQALSIYHSSSNQKDTFFISALFFASIFDIIYIYRNLSHWLVTYIVILHSLFPFLSSSLIRPVLIHCQRLIHMDSLVLSPPHEEFLSLFICKHNIIATI